MTWTYSTDSEKSAVDLVRLMLGDSDVAHNYLSDWEILYAMTKDSDLHLVSARCCDMIIAKLARNIADGSPMLKARIEAADHYNRLKRGAP